MMKHRVVWVLVLTGLAAVVVWAQEKPETVKPETEKPEPVKARLVGVDETPVDADGKPPLDEKRVLHPFAGQRSTNFYLVVKVKREVPANVSSPMGEMKVQLMFRVTRPIEPYGVAVEKKELTEDGLSYKAADKSRWVDEWYYFGVTRGQREWGVAVNGKTVGQVLDWYATLIVRNVDGVSSRIELPGGDQQVLTGHRQVQFQFPTGSYDLVLEVRGHGKVPLPWKKYDRGDFKYLAVASDIRNAPTIPGERLRKALPKIYFAWKKYHTREGVGGGSYNIGNADNPVHVQIYFGQGGAPGPLWKCEVDSIEVEYGAGVTSGRRGRTTRPAIVRYGERYGRSWEVHPWEKQKDVYMPADADKVVGEVATGQFVVRSVEKSPSTWTKEGLLSKGLLFDKDYGYLDASVKKQGELVVITAEKGKEP
ncbi:MAG TPA: hypothetical protein VMZ92_08855 [Planctomycetota bacterium]|nr:hypothetical protein [Planctomycetota bacterium]